ncbi:unnamed protein product, partial [Cuscuta epithymum]
MKDKHEVVDIFRKFYNMVQVQFNEKIKIFRSDNGREYFSNTLTQFFNEKGMIQQSSCVDTPQQNGVAERKNRHLLEITRALLLANHVPKYFWGDALLTAVYLINRMPSKPLSFQTPIQKIHEFNCDLKPFVNLPFKIFGCTVFVSNRDKTKSKL